MPLPEWANGWSGCSGRPAGARAGRSAGVRGAPERGPGRARGRRGPGRRGPGRRRCPAAFRSRGRGTGVGRGALGPGVLRVGGRRSGGSRGSVAGAAGGRGLGAGVLGRLVVAGPRLSAPAAYVHRCPLVRCVSRACRTGGSWVDGMRRSPPLPPRTPVSTPSFPFLPTLPRRALPARVPRGALSTGSPRCRRRAVRSVVMETSTEGATRPDISPAGSGEAVDTVVVAGPPPRRPPRCPRPVRVTSCSARCCTGSG